MEFSRPEHGSGSPFPSPGDLSQPRDWTQVSCNTGRFFTSWTTRKALATKENLQHIGVAYSNTSSTKHVCPSPSADVVGVIHSSLSTPVRENAGKPSLPLPPESSSRGRGRWSQHNLIRYFSLGHRIGRKQGKAIEKQKHQVLDSSSQNVKILSANLIIETNLSGDTSLCGQVFAPQNPDWNTWAGSTQSWRPHLAPFCKTD